MFRPHHFLHPSKRNVIHHQNTLGIGLLKKSRARKQTVKKSDYKMLNASSPIFIQKITWSRTSKFGLRISIMLGLFDYNNELRTTILSHIKSNNCSFCIIPWCCILCDVANSTDGLRNEYAFGAFTLIDPTSVFLKYKAVHNKILITFYHCYFSNSSPKMDRNHHR